MLRTGIVEEKRRKIVKAVKATWGYSIVRAKKAGGQSCIIPPLCDEMVLKCLFNYLKRDRMLRTGLVEEKRRKLVKASKGHLGV